MTDADDPFGDLDEAIEDDPSESQSVDLDPDPEVESELESDDGTVPQEQVGTLEVDQDEDKFNRPAFPFDDAKQDSLYARKEAWQQFEDTLDFEVKRTLRERGHEDIGKRELHDAALRILSNHAEEIADELERQRSI